MLVRMNHCPPGRIVLDCPFLSESLLPCFSKGTAQSEDKRGVSCTQELAGWNPSRSELRSWLRTCRGHQGSLFFTLPLAGLPHRASGTRIKTFKTGKRVCTFSRSTLTSQPSSLTAKVEHSLKPCRPAEWGSGLLWEGLITAGSHTCLSLCPL